jgi:hypothetical protein
MIESKDAFDAAELHARRAEHYAAKAAESPSYPAYRDLAQTYAATSQAFAAIALARAAWRGAS